MYDADMWVGCKELTSRQLMEYLILKTNPDTRICICGSGNVYLHLTGDKSVMSLDNDSLSELDEYDGREPLKITEVLHI